MKIEFGILTDGGWGIMQTTTKTMLKYNCRNGHTFDFKYLFIAFESLQKEHEEGELSCSCKECGEKIKYKIKKLAD